MSIRILIADDHPLIRQGIRAVLSDFEEMEIVGEGCNGNEALLLTNELHPDILVLDICMPGLKAIQILSKLKLTNQHTHVLLLTMCDDPLTIKVMIKEGIKGYIVKDEDMHTLVDAIRRIMSGKTWLGATATDVMTESLTKDNTTAMIPILSYQETMILQLLGHGYASGQISLELNLSIRTVHYHIDRIVEKLQVRNRTEAVAISIQNGWIQF
jgi:two-component system, NarL family, invasion response regulator UvrY